MIDSDDIVVGDLVLLQAGDKIPADGILAYGHLSVNNAALNGETEECHKEAVDKDQPFPEQITGDTFVDGFSLFRGAIVYDGEGVLLVKKTGLQTMMGHMALEMQEEEPASPLQVKLFYSGRTDLQDWLYWCCSDCPSVYDSFCDSGRRSCSLHGTGLAEYFHGCDQRTDPCYCDHCLCSTGRTSAYDFPGTDAEYQQNAGSQCSG